MTKLLTGEKLTKRCEQLGIDTRGEYMDPKAIRMRSPRGTDAELQQRLHAYERSIRESRMWMLALVSALASVASAIVAVVVVLAKVNV